MGRQGQHAYPFMPPHDREEEDNKFKRHFSDRFIRVDESWRRPKGIDSCVRRKFRGKTLMPNIGYGSNKKTKHMLSNGFKKFLVHNVKELELLMMHNTVYAAEIAHDVSLKVRNEINERAEALDIKVLNRNARMTTEDDE